MGALGGRRGRDHRIDHYGASAPAGTIFKEFGFTTERVADVGRRVVRDGLHGRQKTLYLPTASTRRSSPATRASAARRPATPATTDPGRADARRLRRRPRRRHVQGRARSRGSPSQTAGEHELIDLGGDGSDPQDDYPDFAQRLGLAIQDGRADRGILICGSGVGASVAANKMRGIRTAVCHDTYSAHQGVEHDDMNVLTLGARVIGIEPAVECALAFLGATFSGEPRHLRRLDKVLAIEAESMGATRPTPTATAGGPPRSSRMPVRGSRPGRSTPMLSPRP